MGKHLINRRKNTNTPRTASVCMWCWSKRQQRTHKYLHTLCGRSKLHDKIVRKHLVYLHRFKHTYILIHKFTQVNIEALVRCARTLDNLKRTHTTAHSTNTQSAWIWLFQVKLNELRMREVGSWKKLQFHSAKSTANELSIEYIEIAGFVCSFDAMENWRQVKTHTHP